MSMMTEMMNMIAAKGEGKGGKSGSKGGSSWGGGDSWQQKQNTFNVDKSGGELGELSGVIKSFSMKTNYGFIDCPEITAAGYGDVFLHGDMKKGYQQGMVVKFDCVLNKDGKPVAINLKSGIKDGDTSLMENAWQYKHKVGSFQLDNSGGELGEFSGTIKSFGMMKNYGFIECPDVSAAG